MSDYIERQTPINNNGSILAVTDPTPPRPVYSQGGSKESKQKRGISTL